MIPNTEQRVVRHPDGRVEFVGLTTPGPVRVVYEAGRFAVLRGSGGKTWHNRLAGYAYSPGSYALVEWHRAGDRCLVRRDVESGKDWRATLATLKAEADSLAKSTRMVQQKPWPP